MTEEISIVNEALRLSQWFKVFPLAKHTVVPLSGSSGHLDATNDHETILDMFVDKAPEGNIGGSMIGTDIFVLDIDRKSPEQDGMKSLNKLNLQGEGLGSDSVIVETRSGGLHCYYRTPEKIEHKIGWLENVDVIKNGIALPPSKAINSNGELGHYKIVQGSFDDIREPPQWVLNAILQSQSQKATDSRISINYTPTRKKWTAKVFEEMAEGVGEPGRNSWMTAQIGRMFYLGTNPETVYAFAQIMNENFVTPPLKDNELNKIFGSILKREAGKQVQEA